MLAVSSVAGAAFTRRHGSEPSFPGALFGVSLVLYFLSPLTTLAAVIFGWGALQRGDLTAREENAIRFYLSLAIASTVIFVVLAAVFSRNLNLKF